MNLLPPQPQRIENHLRDRIRKVALHELGHYVAANVVGFETGGVQLEIIDRHGGYRGGAEISLPRALRTISDTEKYLRDRVVVLWAGALAQTLQGGKVSADDACKCLSDETGANDHAKARELMNLLRNLRFPDVAAEDAQAGLTALEEEIWGDTVRIVEAEEHLIASFADRLAQLVRMTATKYSLTHADIKAAPNFVARFGRR